MMFYFFIFVLLFRQLSFNVTPRMWTQLMVYTYPAVLAACLDAGQNHKPINLLSKDWLAH